MSSPRTSTSPVWTPARMSRPRTAARSSDCTCAVDRSGWAVERRDESVSGRVDLSAAIVPQLFTDAAIVGIEERTPATVSDLCRQLGRVDDVAEQDRCEDSLDRDRRAFTGHELGDLVGDDEIGPREGQVAAGQFDEGRIGDVRREIATDAPLEPGADSDTWSTSVGTRINGSACRTSVARRLAVSALAVRGVDRSRATLAQSAPRTRHRHSGSTRRRNSGVPQEAANSRTAIVRHALAATPIG